MGNVAPLNASTDVWQKVEESSIMGVKDDAYQFANV